MIIIIIIKINGKVLGFRAGLKMDTKNGHKMDKNKDIKIWTQNTTFGALSWAIFSCL
jgi:hypothetical protein